MPFPAEAKPIGQNLHSVFPFPRLSDFTDGSRSSRLENLRYGRQLCPRYSRLPRRLRASVRKIPRLLTLNSQPKSLLTLHLIAIEQLLIPQIQATIDHDRMRPDLSLRMPPLTLRAQLEPAGFLPSRG